MKLVKIYFILTFIFLTIAGCSPQKEEQPLSRRESENKIIQILENDYDLNPITQWAGDTFWLYIPTEKPLFAISASPRSQPIKKKYILQFIDTVFEDNVLRIEYDVVPAFKIAVPNGISNRYTQEFNLRYQNVTHALSRSFFTSENPPQFIVLVIADIKEGIELATTFYLEDLKKYQSGALPQDEYGVRIQTEPAGNKEIKHDITGAHIEYKDIDIKNFIAKQVATRITFKFQNSDFPPDKNYEDEIVNAIIKTFHAYDFNDFTSVLLNDLRTKKETIFSRKQINEMQSSLPKEKPASEGKIITIDFSEMMKQSQEE